MNASKHIHRGVFAGIVWVHLSLTAQHLPNLNLLDYHHCQNTNRWKITWKNAVHPSSTVPEACSKVHRICSGGSQWLDYDARLFQSVFLFSFVLIVSTRLHNAPQKLMPSVCYRYVTTQKLGVFLNLTIPNLLSFQTHHVQVYIDHGCQGYSSF